MRKGIFTLIIAVACSIASLHSQEIKWAFPIVPVSDDYGINLRLSSLCIDNNDNLYAITSIKGQYDLDTTKAENLIGGEDHLVPVLTKISSNGIIQWTETIINESNGCNYVTDAACDADGNIYITGYFEEEIDFNPGDGEYLMEAPKGEEMFILKLDSDGNFLWAKQYGGPDAYTSANAIKVTATNIYIAGAFKGEVEFDTVYESNGSAEDVFALKLALDGTIEWSYYFGGEYMDEATAIDVDAEGNAYIAGYFQGEDVEFGKGGYTEKHTTSYKGDNIDLFVAKIKEQLTLSGVRTVGYVKVVGGNGYETCLSLLVNTNNEVYFKGTLSGETDFNYGYSSSLTLEPSGDYDTYIAKLNSYGGSPQAAKANWYLSDNESIDDARGLFLKGDYLYVYELNFPKVYNATDLSLVYENSWIDGEGIEMVVGSDGAVYALGKGGETIELYPTKWDNKIEFNQETSENFILYKLDLGIQTNTASDNLNPDNGCSAYPNPTTGIISFTNANEIQSISVYNVQGVQVKSFSRLSGNSIDISSMPNCLYILSITLNDNSVIVKKLVKQ